MVCILVASVEGISPVVVEKTVDQKVEIEKSYAAVVSLVALTQCLLVMVAIFVHDEVLDIATEEHQAEVLHSDQLTFGLAPWDVE